MKLCKNCEFHSLEKNDHLCNHPSSLAHASPVTGTASCSVMRASIPCGLIGRLHEPKTTLWGKLTYLLQEGV